MINSGNAIVTNPAMKSPSRITGKNTMKRMIFAMLHVARMEKDSSFPNMPKNKIKNNMVNILFPP